MHGHRVLITKHDAPEAVVLSMDEFLALTEMHQGERQLNLLRDQFDAQLAAMQTPEAKAAGRRLFAASPRELGQAALAGAQRRARLKRG